MGRKVVIYARVSTEHEAQLSALDNQVQYYDGILEQHPDWELVDKYIDEGITGTSTKKRKNFMRMMNDAEKGLFDLIITREVSRFARNTVDTLQETRKLKRIGIEVWFTEDNIWTLNDEDGELRLTIMATLAQNESKKTSIRVKAGQMVSFQNAVPYGNGNILGYDKLPNHGGYVINPEQAETVKMIFDLYLNGTGVRSIQFELEKRGRLTAMGNAKWHCPTISKILKNAFYCGTVVYRKEVVPDYLEQKKIKNKDLVDKIVVEGKHEPIISKEDFDKVQEIMNSKTMNSSKKGKMGYNLSTDIWGKHLKCCCGSNMSKVKWHTTTYGVIQYAYHCYKQLRYGTVKTRLKKGLSIEGICDSQMVAKWKLDSMAKILFEQFFTDKKQLYVITNNLLDKCIKNELYEDDNSEKAKKIEANLRKNEGKLDRLVEMRLADEISKEMYNEKRAKLENDIAEAQSQLAELTQKKEASESDLQDKLKLLKYAADQRFQFDTNDIPESIIDAFVDKVIVFPDYFEWHLKSFRDDDDDSDNSIRCLVKGTKNKSEVLFVDDTLTCDTQDRLLLQTNKIELAEA